MVRCPRKQIQRDITISNHIFSKAITKWTTKFDKTYRERKRKDKMKMVTQSYHRYHPEIFMIKESCNLIKPETQLTAPKKEW